MTSTIKTRVFSLLALLSLNSCGELYNITNRCTSSHVNPDWDALERDRVQAEARWRANKPSNYYRYTYRSLGFSLRQDIYVEVSGSSVTVFDGTGKVLSSENAQYYGPVENLFSSLRSSITNRSSACLTASVKYNSSMGYPETFSVADEKEGLQDAFGGFTVTDFNVSPPTPHP